MCYLGFGVVVSFELVDALIVDWVCVVIKVIWNVISFGGVETMMERCSVYLG